jgi:uncharacterized protein
MADDRPRREDAPDDPVRTRFEPPMSVAGEPFWAATRDRRLVLPWCDDCGRPHWFPRDACPQCLGDRIEWREASGRGVVHAVSVMPKPAMPLLADRVPYAVALVDLDEGVRMMTNVVGVDPAAVTVGQLVEATWEPLTDGRNLLVFQPAAG